MRLPLILLVLQDFTFLVWMRFSHPVHAMQALLCAMNAFSFAHFPVAPPLPR